MDKQAVKIPLPIIPNYKVIRELGRGGMGVVYLAEHEVLDRPTALKVMVDQPARAAELRERMAREAKTMARLTHPNIVQVHDFIQFEGGIALVMEYVEGRNLEQMIGREVGPIPHERALRLFNQLLQAVNYAHAKGVVHRDLKPSNVLVTTDNVVKVTDFGIAKVAGQSKLTRTGTILGTPVYMAPEQILGKQVDHRADIYALGMTLYVMLAGRAPFDEDETSEFVFMKSCLEDPIPDPREFYPYIPESLVEILHHALARDLDQRIQNCDVLFKLLSDTDLSETISYQEAAHESSFSGSNLPEPLLESQQKEYENAVQLRLRELVDEMENGEYRQYFSKEYVIEPCRQLLDKSEKEIMNGVHKLLKVRGQQASYLYGRLLEAQEERELAKEYLNHSVSLKFPPARDHLNVDREKDIDGRATAIFVIILLFTFISIIIGFCSQQ